MKSSWLVVVILGLQSTLAYTSDLSNNKKETELNRIYQKYNSEPTDQEVWSLVTEQSGVQTYQTQKGDTLWDISEMLFGDGFFWPKVWSLNPTLTNPHTLSSGTQLSFYPGSVDEAPHLDFADSEESENHQVNSSEVLPEVYAMTLNVEIPPPRKQYSPLLTEFPSSLPSWRYRGPAETEKITFDLQRPPKQRPIEKYISYYVTSSELSGEGEVVDIEMGMDSASEHQYVFVRAPGKAVGDVLTVLDSVGKIDDKFSGKTALMIQVQGSIRIVESVHSEENLFRALVIKSISPIGKKSKVVSEALPIMDLNSAGQMGQVSARIFGGEHGLSRKLFGPEGILFLNQGRASGLSEGQILPVYKNQSIRTDTSFVKENPRVIGQVRVVKTSEDFSTAVVLSADEEIYVGDGTSVETATDRR